MYIRHVDPSIDHKDLTLKETPKKDKKYKREEGVSRQVERRSRSVGLWLPLSSPTNPTPPLLPYLTAQTLFRPPAPKEDSVPCSSTPIAQLAANSIKISVAANAIVALSCEENNRDQHENLRGIVQVVVLKKTNKNKKTNKSTMTKRHRLGGGSQRGEHNGKDKQKHNVKKASNRWFSTR